ncbi:MAG: hypothetical protein RLZZ262_2646 [Bacteroidota bacterium]|jgi:hypothetical protein
MFRRISIILICFNCWSCGTPEAEAPLSLPQMIDVLTEVRILEGSYAAIVTKPDTLRPYMSTYYEQIFARHGIDHEKYYKAYDYYMSRPDVMEAIEDSVINRISNQLNNYQ